MGVRTATYEFLGDTAQLITPILWKHLEISEGFLKHLEPHRDVSVYSQEIMLHWHAHGVATCVYANSFQLHSTLCNPMDCSPPGSSVHGILQVRILEWVAISSRGSSPPRDGNCISCVSCIGKRVLYY